MIINYRSQEKPKTNPRISGFGMIWAYIFYFYIYISAHSFGSSHRLMIIALLGFWGPSGYGRGSAGRGELGIVLPWKEWHSNMIQHVCVCRKIGYVILRFEIVKLMIIYWNWRSFQSFRQADVLNLSGQIVWLNLAVSSHVQSCPVTNIPLDSVRLPEDFKPSDP